MPSSEKAVVTALSEILYERQASGGKTRWEIKLY